MENPMKVLVVEHRQADCRIAEQLLADYELDFSWQCVESPLELRRIAADFDPNIVLCTDDASVTSSSAVLDALRLLCPQAPVILVSSVRATDAATGEAQLLSRSVSKPTAAQPDVSVTAWPRPQGAEDIANLRRCFSLLLGSCPSPAVMSNAEGCITHANVSACRQLDYTCDHSLGTLLGSPADASHRLAYFDAWTRQPTLIHTHEIVGSVIARKGVRSPALALVALDLDSARISVERLLPIPGADRQCEVPQYASMLRIAADDFLWVLPHLPSAADAADVVQRVLESIDNSRLAAVAPDPPIKIIKVLAPEVTGRIAESYHSSASHPPRAVRKAPTVVHENSRLEARLTDALQRQQLIIQFQPQFELHTGRGCGVEALARWTLCNGQTVGPSVFIPLAERIGMIDALGAWVLKAACEAAYTWCRDAQRTTLSVNVSALQIHDDFSTVIRQTLKNSGFPAKQLELEITESALVGHADQTIECLNQWKRLGVQIAVDDFGTGYSSLNYLSRLPVDRLKLDQSLIHRMTVDAKSATVLRSIISLGAELGIDVVAEGVETEQQLRMLQDFGCPRVQGYLLARPMSPKQASVVLRKAWGNRTVPIFHPKTTYGEAHVQ